MMTDSNITNNNITNKRQQPISSPSPQPSYTLNDYNQAIKQHAFNSPHLFCGDPPLVPNAQSNLHRHQKHFVFPIGQEANYECEQGFRPIDGQSQTRCILDGIHPSSIGHILFPDIHHHSVDTDNDSNSPNIRLGSNRSKNSKRLNDGDDDENEHDLNSATNDKSRFLDGDFFVGDKRKMSRKNDANDDDLDDLDSSNKHPKQHAHWSPLVTLNCQPVNCSQPLEIPNAKMIFNKSSTSANFSFNSNVHYVCDEGYETIGFPVLTCRADGQWNRQPPECRLKQCPQLPELKNGRISYSDAERRIHSRADYLCNHGYRLNAISNTRICGSNDRWSPLEQYFKATIGSNSTQNVAIQNNSTNEIYECIAVTCPTPVRPHNGLRIVDVNRKQRMNRNFFIPGDIIIFSCMSNRLKLTAKCRDDGEWSQRMPHCPMNEFSTLKCAPITTFSHGTVKIVNQTRALFSCNDGYELDGATTINCNINGAWSGPLPRCVVRMIISTDNHQSILDSSNNHQHLSESSHKDLDNEERSISNTLLILLIIIFILLFIIISIGMVAFCRWRQRRMNSKVWQRYFGHYYHRQSKTNIMLSTHFGSNYHHHHSNHPHHQLNGGSSASTTSTNNGGGGDPVTIALSSNVGGDGPSSNARLLKRGNNRSKSTYSKTSSIGTGNGILQSSFSSADETTADLKSTAETIISERARTISTYVADDTCAEDDEYDDDDDCGDCDDDIINDYSPTSIYRSTTFPLSSTIVQQHSLPLDILGGGKSIDINIAKRTLSSDNNSHQIISQKNAFDPILSNDLFDTTTTTRNQSNGGIPVTDL
uniref:CUB and sushi domain-containing protein 1-like n=1 Tax=Dermatophagoides pteronyssinus TaxID=6956 RepID=A0A6P6YDU9_DERPT|nr:CUB and sushi domain-containing protein 1-like [Dermatophagoides pteronyssinus]